ncbi:hypothetical protein [Cohnella candidum]|uniref:DUF3221 domain-containing protein n=1 Tax=Cohnella candidum TaxID=2674991 RepID=A0A3G3JWA6_9BACL|nr:hypothetical protein [Cohnella candidum]AYQ72505.1 hypothetical protein EAV92_07950 [Cohnella candidum]
MGVSAGVRSLLLLGVLALSGCGERPPAEQDMTYYAQGLAQMDSVFKKYDLAHIGSGVQTDGVHLEVRKRHDPMKPVSESEIKSIKEAIYEEYDREFPLVIEIWTMPETPSVDGKITGMDGKRLLVTGPAAKDGAGPRAMWLGVGEDTVIVNGKTGEPMAWDQLKIGYKVKAWSEPLVATSYPEQSGLLRLEVMEAVEGGGDLQGTVTKIGIGIEDTTQRELQVDGKPYLVLPTAVFRNGDREAKFEDLKEGDRVAVWFAGYSVNPDEQMISQVVLTP